MPVRTVAIFSTSMIMPTPDLRSEECSANIAASDKNVKEIYNGANRIASRNIARHLVLRQTIKQ